MRKYFAENSNWTLDIAFMVLAPLVISSLLCYAFIKNPRLSFELLAIVAALCLVLSLLSPYFSSTMHSKAIRSFAKMRNKYFLTAITVVFAGFSLILFRWAQINLWDNNEFGLAIGLLVILAFFIYFAFRLILPLNNWKVWMTLDFGSKLPGIHIWGSVPTTAQMRVCLVQSLITAHSIGQRGIKIYSPLFGDPINYARWHRFLMKTLKANGYVPQFKVNALSPEPMNRLTSALYKSWSFYARWDKKNRHVDKTMGRVIKAGGWEIFF